MRKLEERALRQNKLSVLAEVNTEAGSVQDKGH
jgi:hypothetical protein